MNGYDFERGEGDCRPYPTRGEGPTMELAVEASLAAWWDAGGWGRMDDAYTVEPPVVQVRYTREEGCTYVVWCLWGVGRP